HDERDEAAYEQASFVDHDRLGLGRTGWMIVAELRTLAALSSWRVSRYVCRLPWRIDGRICRSSSSWLPWRRRKRLPGRPESPERTRAPCAGAIRRGRRPG